MTYADQLNHHIILHAVPKRIISLVPSQTELLYDLGLDNEVIGITKFCVHPHQWFRSKTRIGGTKNIHIEKIKELQPDLIIANKEENVMEQVESLQMFSPVWVSDVNDLDDALWMIRSIGALVNRSQQSEVIAKTIEQRFSFASLHTERQIPACYLIWKDPYMTVGGDTFISDMMQRAGMVNVFASLNRYPEISLEQIRHSGCEIVILSSEPYPFKETDVNVLQQLLPDQRIILADGEMFSWYGSRLQHAPSYFSDLIRSIS